MAAHVLVVATVTATSDDLLAALQERAKRVRHLESALFINLGRGAPAHSVLVH